MIQARMSEAGILYTWHEFNGAHAFLRDEGPRYDPALALICYRMVVDLFTRKLGEGDFPAEVQGAGETRGDAQIRRRLQGPANCAGGRASSSASRPSCPGLDNAA